MRPTSPSALFSVFHFDKFVGRTNYLQCLIRARGIRISGELLPVLEESLKMRTSRQNLM